jgi:threonine dehydratase
VGVSAANAPSSYLSFEAGRPVPTPSALTFADGLATREPDADAVATICQGAARVLTVSEDAMAEAVRIYFDATHQVVEGAGAAPLAAFLQDPVRAKYENVGLVMTGGNIERARLLAVLGGKTPAG